MPRILISSLVMGFAVWAGLALVQNQLGTVFGSPGKQAGSEVLRILSLMSLVGLGVAVYGTILLSSGGAALADLKGLRRSSLKQDSSPPT